VSAPMYRAMQDLAEQIAPRLLAEAEREYGLLTNEQLMTSAQDAVYEGEGDDD
jgi:hypothetical protein